MKLARPDVFHPRIVLASDLRSAGSDDEAAILAVLRGRGLHAHPLSWDDLDTLGADLVILHAITETTARSGRFLSWIKEVPNLLNPPEVIAWNADPGYLDDLARAGVATSSRSDSGDESTAVVFFGGAQSHAFGPDGAEADFEVWDLGHAALRATADRLGIAVSELLYARIDVTGGPDDARLLSLDLIAPHLGWQQLDADARQIGQRQFALCVESALDQLGLGPLSHRSPQRGGGGGT